MSHPPRNLKNWKQRLWLFCLLWPCAVGAASSVPAVSTVASLRALSRVEMNRGLPFSLSGTVTMVDASRNIFVLQDATGAMLIHPDVLPPVKPGTSVLLSAERGAPYTVNCPGFPFVPSGWDVQTNYEGPTNWGDFHLTRMAALLRPPRTGDYTFWLASDNSGELWLSRTEKPTEVRQIASLKAGYWVGPHEWSRYASQRSDPITLEAGREYYLEAFTEQVETDEHLAVAWQGPGIAQSVIEGQYLAPWGASSNRVHGVLREYWTNFTCGTLALITAERPFEFGLSATGMSYKILGTNAWPKPLEVELGSKLAVENNFCWAQTEAQVVFSATPAGEAAFELRAGQNRAMAHVANWAVPPPPNGPTVAARLTGVCEGIAGASGDLIPGVFWAASDRDVITYEAASANANADAPKNDSGQTPYPALGGYFSVRGVVTFNGHVLDKDYLVVQDANAGMFIVPAANPWPPAAQLLAGSSVEIGGHLLPSHNAVRLRPRTFSVVGQRTFPVPLAAAPGESLHYREGQWTEVEGVCRAVETNGMLVIRRGEETLNFWVKGCPPDALNALLDCGLRARGVISLDFSLPLLLIPSRESLQILEPARTNLETQPIASLSLPRGGVSPAHRAQIRGTVTYCDDLNLFVQDGSGAIRVESKDKVSVAQGDHLEVTGYPEELNLVMVLTDATMHQLPDKKSVLTRPLDLNAPNRELPNQALVRIKAYLLAQKDLENSEGLEVQTGQRVFQALLPPGQRLPRLEPGSLLELTGVCMLEFVPASSGKLAWENSSISTARLLLRRAGDVMVVRGPPWWNWKKAAALIILLLALLTAALLRAHLLRRRFERQQAARLAFARQLLDNQESERRRIAANLHDTLGQNLLAIKNQTHLAMQSAGDLALQKRLEDISGTVLHALEEVRQITHDLRPYQLDRLGLSQAVRALVRKVSESSSIELASHVDNIDGLFPKEVEINLYRIVQEGINNVMKHSQATEAAVVLKVDGRSLRISIRDNGKGLALGTTTEEGSTAGFGLSGIRERARIMNGRVEVDAPPGQGFNLKIEIPLPASSATGNALHGSASPADPSPGVAVSAGTSSEIGSGKRTSF